MIQRNGAHKAPNLKIGTTVKKLAVEVLTSAEEVAGTVTDTLITVRSGVELLYNAINEANIESRTDVALAVQAGLDRLMNAGMSEEEAREFLQVERVAVKVTERAKVSGVKRQPQTENESDKFLRVDQDRKTTGSGE